MRKIGPGVRAEPGRGPLEVIILPERGQLRGDVLARLLEAGENLERGHERIILREHGGEPEPRAGDALHIGLHLFADMALLHFLGQARGHVVDALEQALRLGAGQVHRRKHHVEVADGGGDAPAHGLHGVGIALEGIGEHEQAAAFLLKGLELAGEVLGLLAETVAQLERGLAHLVDHGALAAPHRLPRGIARGFLGFRLGLLRGGALPLRLVAPGFFFGVGSLGGRGLLALFFGIGMFGRLEHGFHSSVCRGGVRVGHKARQQKAGQQKAAQGKGGQKEGAAKEGARFAPPKRAKVEGEGGHGPR